MAINGFFLGHTTKLSGVLFCFLMVWPEFVGSGLQCGINLIYTQGLPVQIHACLQACSLVHTGLSSFQRQEALLNASLRRETSEMNLQMQAVLEKKSTTQGRKTWWPH